jgi:hypothetical protein
MEKLNDEAEISICNTDHCSSAGEFRHGTRDPCKLAAQSMEWQCEQHANNAV